MKIVTKLKFLCIAILLICSAYSSSAEKRLHSRVFSHSVANRKNPNAVCETPGSLKRAFGFIVDKGKKILDKVTPQAWKDWRKAVQDLTKTNIEQKIQLLNEIKAMKINNQDIKLSDSQIIRIHYYIGTKTYQEIENSRNQIKENVMNFIKRTTGDSNNLDFYRAIKKILRINDQEVSSILPRMYYLSHSIYFKIHKDINKYFKENEENKFTHTKKFFRFSERLKKYSKKSHSRNRIEIPESVDVTNAQFILDTFKTNLDLINNKAKGVVENIESAKEVINNSQLLLEMTKSIKSLDKLVVVDKVIDKLKTSVQQLDKIPLDKVKVATTRAEIVSLIIGIQQGEATAEDVISLANKLATEFHISGLQALTSNADTLLQIRNQIGNIGQSSKPSLEIANILLGLGNIASLIPNNETSEVVSVFLKKSGEMIQEYKSIQDILDQQIENSVTNFQEQMDQSTLPFFSQLFSDFAIDDFLYNPSSPTTNGHTNTSLIDVFNEIRSKYEDSPLKAQVENAVKAMTDERESAQSQGRIDRYTDVGSDWSIGESSSSVTPSEFFEAVKEKFNELTACSSDSTDRSSSTCPNPNPYSEYVEDPKNAYDMTVEKNSECMGIPDTTQDIVGGWVRRYFKKMKRLRKLK